MLHLYHNAGSSNSQRVRIALAEKGLPWESHLVQPGQQHTSEFRAISPSGTVPVLVDNGNALTDSVVINEYLEDSFPEPMLRPGKAYEVALIRQWTKHADDYLQRSIAVFTHALVRRSAVLAQFDGDVNTAIAGINDPIILGWRGSVYAEGVESPHVLQAMRLIQASLTMLESALQKGAWLTGDRFSLAEIALLPAIYRLECLDMNFLWAANCPAVKAWLQRGKSRASFQKAVLSYLTPNMLQSYHTSGIAHRSSLERMAASAAPL